MTEFSVREVRHLRDLVVAVGRAVRKTPAQSDEVVTVRADLFDRLNTLVDDYEADYDDVLVEHLREREGNGEAED